MMHAFDDSPWLSATDELGDEWVEDDTMGNLYWEAARHRLRESESTTREDPPEAAAALPRPRDRDDVPGGKR